MFRGRFESSIDIKGRTSVPSKFREILSSRSEEKLILTNFDGCLWAYPVKAWQEIEEKIAQLPQLKPEVKALQRVFVSAASECPIDKQGRILLPAYLKDHAEIKRDVIIVGVSNRIEIWSKEKWQEFYANSRQSFEQIAEKLYDGGAA